MNHVVVYIHPFTLDQEVGAYVNGECIQSVKCKIDEIDKTCIALCEKYNIEQVDIAGSQAYAARVRDKIVENKFDKFNIKVVIY